MNLLLPICEFYNNRVRKKLRLCFLIGGRSFSLQFRIAKFEEDLESYSKQVEEFQSYGDMEELPRYLKKALTLDGRLQKAVEIIDQFNEEERAYGFEESNYPLRKQVSDKLGPYKKLYENASDFMAKFDLWMNTRIGSFDPEEIETDAGNWYRTIYKLEKQFSEQPATRQLAQNVREKIEEFRGHMPIVQTLGNPGMKPRHWERVSEIIGFPLKADDTLTLARIIDLGLDEYIPRFEAISESATKENNLEKGMEKMMREWADMEFVCNPYRWVHRSIFLFLFLFLCPRFSRIDSC